MVTRTAEERDKYWAAVEALAARVRADIVALGDPPEETIMNACAVFAEIVLAETPPETSRAEWRSRANRIVGSFLAYPKLVEKLK